MMLFEEIHRKLPGIQTAADVYSIVEGLFDDAGNIVGWTFDAEAEAVAAKAIGASSPDVLLLVPTVFNNHCVAMRRYPKEFQKVLAAMRRTVADALIQQFEPQSVSSEGLRIVLMVPWLAGNPNGNILRVVAGYLAGLEKLETVDSVDLLITNENAVASDSHIAIRRIDSSSGKVGHEQAFKESSVNRAEVFYAPPPLSGEGCTNAVKRFLAEKKPNLIFVPNVEMTSYFVHGFNQAIASVYLQTSLNNRPPYDFDRYLYLGGRREIDNSHIHPDRWHFHYFGYDLFGDVGDFSRSDIGLSDADIVLVTAGNRLEREVTEEIAAVVASAMRVDSRVKWLLLGVQDEAAVRANIAPVLGELADRVVCHGYVQEIGRYFELCDIYVNPRRTGGAVSMALSVYGATPVLSFPVNDACNFILPELICDTPEAYGAKLTDLVANPGALTEVAQKQKSSFLEHHSVEASARDLVSHCHAAMAGRREN